MLNMLRGSIEHLWGTNRVSPMFMYLDILAPPHGSGGLAVKIRVIKYRNLILSNVGAHVELAAPFALVLLQEREAWAGTSAEAFPTSLARAGTSAEAFPTSPLGCLDVTRLCDESHRRRTNDETGSASSVSGV